MLYEFLGTTILTLAFNINGSKIDSSILLIVSWWSWEISTAHFNLAVTLGNLLFKPHTMVSNLPLFLKTAVAQVAGAAFGTLLTYFVSTRSNDELLQYVWLPNVEPLCP